MKHQWKTVEDALRWAHYWQVKTLIKSPSVQRSSKSSDPNALTQLDNVAQAALIISMCRRELPEIDFDVLSLLYTVPGDAATQARKEFLAAYVGHRIHEQTGRPKWWTVDVLREWSGAKPLHTQSWWSHNISVPVRTLYSWAKGRNDKAIYTVVERDLSRAVDALHDPMRRCRLLD